MATATTTAPGLSRVERRRASTRARIVEAAERLMRERGVESVTIQDITDAADVGHGTFYLHFETKAEVLRPIIEHLSEQLHAEVDRAAQGAHDPALRMALGLRVLLQAIARDPLWSWYARSGTSFRGMVADMGPRPMDDIRHGLKSGRLDLPDLPATWSFLDGAIIGVIKALDENARVDTAAETAAELVLRVLGLPAEEAAQLAREPLALHGRSATERCDVAD